MPSTNTSPSAGSTVVDKLKTYEGGTGQSSAAAALAALGAVPLATVNQPSGVAGLDANKKLSTDVLPLDNLSVISAQGPSTVVKGSITQYTLTNYDVFTPYTITAISGTVSQNGEIINYTAPSTPQAGGFIVNGRKFNVTVSDYAPVTPTLAVLDTGGQGAVASLVHTGSAFVMQGNSDTHLNTDWQVATDSDFTNIVAQSMADATNKTTWTTTGLNLTTTYYSRCRYRSSGNFVSAWSNVVTRTTKASYSLSVEEAILNYTVQTGGSGGFGYPSSNVFARSIAISADGSRVAIGNTQEAFAGFSNIGSVYVFVRTGSTWSLEQRIIAPDYTAGGTTGDDRFGACLGMSDDGTRLVIGAPGVYNTTDTNGAMYVYIRNVSTWTQETKITGASTSGTNYFAECVAISGDGLRVAAYEYSSATLRIHLRNGTTWALEQAVPSANSGSVSAKNFAFTATGDRIVIGHGDASGYFGTAAVLVRTGVTWALEQTLVPTPAPVTNDTYGSSVAISADGTRCVIASSNYYANSNNYIGKASVFRRAGSVWTFEATLQGTGLAVRANFGRCVSINSDGTVIAVSAHDPALATTTPQGVVFTFRRNGTSWTQETKVSGSGLTSNAQFGYSMILAPNGSRFIATAHNANRAYSFTY